MTRKHKESIKYGIYRIQVNKCEIASKRETAEFRANNRNKEIVFSSTSVFNNK